MKAIIEDFLKRLLPWHGQEETTYKSIWVRGPARNEPTKQVFWGHATQKLDELVDMVLFYNRLGREIYFGCGTQRVARAAESGSKWQKSIRTVTNMVAYKAIWLDIDCGLGKEYPTQHAALEALGKFCELAELPEPNQLVNSGNGLHVYWITDVPMPLNVWTEYANALDRATKQHGLKVDSQCTIDAARILRVPGTFNHKSDPAKPIEMGVPGPEYTHAFLEAALKQYMGPQPVKGQRQQMYEYTEMAKKFMEGLRPTHADPVDLVAIADAGCLVLGEAIDTAGRDHKQPLWHLLMLAATFDKDPSNIAHMMSDGYPSYDPNEVDEMLARKQNEKVAKNLGWPSCFSFSRLSPLCQKCPFFADNKSPMHVPLKPVVADDNDLPERYQRDGRGYIMTDWTPNKSTAPAAYEVLRYKMYGAHLLEGSEDLQFKTEIGGKERDILIKLSDLKTIDSLVGALQMQSMMPNQSWHRQLIGPFIMSWIQRLHNMRTPKLAADVFGWGPQQTNFTYGGVTYSDQPPKQAFFRDASSFQYYQPVGELEPWKEAAKALTDQHRPCSDAILATAFGAPLVPFTGMPGLLFSAYSLLSGIGKSTALKVAQAVWGHPVKGMNMLDDTGNAIMKKLADIQSIPLMWDELKMRTEIDEFVKLLFRLTQGREKARLTRDAAARSVGSFSTLMVCTTNESLAEAMGRAVGSTEAGANRVFEIEVDPIPQWALGSASVWNLLIAKLHSNYGKAGEVYAQWLPANTDRINTVVSAVMGYFESKLQAKPDERFWIATMAAVWSGATFANQLQLTTIERSNSF
jgi:hypothetical protein